MTAWRQSSYCHANGTCVGIASHPSGVAIRDEKNPNGHQLAFNKQAWSAFARGLKATS